MQIFFFCAGIRLLFCRMFFPCKSEVVMVGEEEVSVQQGEVLVWGYGWPLTLAGGLTAHDAFPASLQTHLGSVLQRSTPVHYCSTLTCVVILTRGKIFSHTLEANINIHFLSTVCVWNWDRRFDSTVRKQQTGTFGHCCGLSILIWEKNTIVLDT